MITEGGDVVAVCEIQDCGNVAGEGVLCYRHIAQKRKGTLNDNRFNKPNVLYVGEDIHNHTVKPIVYEKTEGECWIITSHSKDPDGYGAVRRYINGVKHSRAHRVSYAYYNGSIAEGELVRHTCDTPSCINPKHLIAGSHLDNMKDRMNSGNYHVEHHRSRKLSEENVLYIDSLIKEGMPYTEISKLTGFNRSTIYDIARGKSWTYLTKRDVYVPKRKREDIKKKQ